MSACVACSHRLRQAARFCDDCGTRVVASPKSQTSRLSRLALIAPPPRRSTHALSPLAATPVASLSAAFRCLSCLRPLSASSDPALDELKALVSRELTSNGVLNKLQAQLRAHIYTTLAAHTATPSPATATPPPNQPTPLPATYHASLEGTLILALVQDYCTFHHLHNTLSVLQLETGQPRPAPAVDRSAIARQLHISAGSAAATHHSLAYELYLLSQTSRPSSPLVSPRSEPHPLPLSHHSSSPSKTTEDLTPPVLSPTRSPTPHRTHSAHSHSHAQNHAQNHRQDDDLRRLHEVETQLAAMRTPGSKGAVRGAGGAGGAGDSSEEYSEDWTGVSLDGSLGGGMGSMGGMGGTDESVVVDVYAGDEVVLDGERWAKRYDYVEAAQRAR